MPARDVDAVLFVKQIPDVWFEEGHFHCLYRVGQKARFEFVFSPSTFLKMRREAGKVVDTFHEERGSVVPMRRKDAKPAHN